jgi:hypothetical protein
MPGPVEGASFSILSDPAFAIESENRALGELLLNLFGEIGCAIYGSQFDGGFEYDEYNRICKVDGEVNAAPFFDF